MKATYDALAPVPEDFPRLLDGMGDLMRAGFDWADEVASLKGPVMLIWGDSDMIRPEHMVEFYHLLGGGMRDGGWMREGMSPNRLAILPNVTHYEMFMAPMLVDVALPFLDGDDAAPVWTGPGAE